MKSLISVIRWSLGSIVLSIILVLITHAQFCLKLLIVSSIVFLIALLIFLFFGGTIHSKEAENTYNRYLSTSLKEGFDPKEQIKCSGAWHLIPNKESCKTLLVKTDAEIFSETLIDDFIISNSVYNDNGLFAVDNSRKKILLLNMLTSTYRVLDYSDLISVSIETDGKMISQKSTMRTIVGAAIGGVVMGSAGAIVGGLSGNTHIGQAVRCVSVKFTIRDTSLPTFDVVLFNKLGVVKPSDPDYYQVNSALSVANKIIALATVVIDEVDSYEKDKNTEHSKSIITNSIADELLKLIALKDKGILTEEEFNIQKQRLLQN